eukprot:1843293-Pyramimonas_sp.AAC.1
MPVQGSSARTYDGARKKESAGESNSPVTRWLIIINNNKKVLLTEGQFYYSVCVEPCWCVRNELEEDLNFRVMRCLN